MINTWTSKTSSCNYTWDASTPSNVKTVVTQAVNWLQRYSDGIRYRLENAFFSGSVKADDLPFYFPQNFAQYLNGTDLPGNIHSITEYVNVNDELITGYAGVVSTSEYASEVAEPWFGTQTPTDWEGYNVSANNTLIYWSSPSLTNSLSLTALGKYLQLC